MILITDKKDCCGCEGCGQICPKQCIDFKADERGFVYPHVNQEMCINCGLCERVCPIINQSDCNDSMSCFAAWSRNEDIRDKSSSGGIFSEIAQYILRNGGVVFGARFTDNFEVIHDYTDNIDGLAAFRGSKYLQSRIGDSFIKVKSFLDDGRMVLFSGTSCQTSALQKFLRKKYTNLILLDIICHGVPSPRVWHDYLEGIAIRNGNGHIRESILHVNFRDKKVGWEKGPFFPTIISPRKGGRYRKNMGDTDPYINCFLRNLSLRPSCFDCPARLGKSCADITIGDFWGIDDVLPGINDNRGCSAVIAYNESGKKLLEEISIEKREVSIDDIAKGNPCLIHSVTQPPQYAHFWHEYILSSNKYKTINAFGRTFRPTLVKRIKYKVIDLLRQHS